MSFLEARWSWVSKVLQADFKFGSAHCWTEKLLESSPILHDKGDTGDDCMLPILTSPFTLFDDLLQLC